MTHVATEDIKALRDETGVSVMQCKSALEEAGGDREKAHAILRAKSSAVAEKKKDRTLGAGTIAAYVHAGGTVAALVELFSETDFVAKNEDFQTLAREIAMQVAAMDPAYTAAVEGKEVTEVLLAQPHIKDQSKTVQMLLEEATQKFGENIALGRVARFAVGN